MWLNISLLHSRRFTTQTFRVTFDSFTGRLYIQLRFFVTLPQTHHHDHQRLPETQTTIDQQQNKQHQKINNNKTTIKINFNINL